ncbi:hypothetical protein RND81_10G150500 [Saponaria officinalis]|uniref:Hydrophobic seed protein domain-containing protein n=1 Tax=Saponaria officinalis TaxID=3572 RepID=A0AAW1I2Y1_SAPOF
MPSKHPKTRRLRRCFRASACVLGDPPSGTKCCALIKGLADLEAAACLCTALKANVLGINLNVPIALSVLLSACEKDVPYGYKCP